MRRMAINTAVAAMLLFTAIGYAQPVTIGAPGWPYYEASSIAEALYLYSDDDLTFEIYTDLTETMPAFLTATGITIHAAYGHDITITGTNYAYFDVSSSGDVIIEDLTFVQYRVDSEGSFGTTNCTYSYTSNLVLAGSGTIEDCIFHNNGLFATISISGDTDIGHCLFYDNTLGAGNGIIECNYNTDIVFTTMEGNDIPAIYSTEVPFINGCIIKSDGTDNENLEFPASDEPPNQLRTWNSCIDENNIGNYCVNCTVDETSPHFIHDEENNHDYRLRRDAGHESPCIDPYYVVYPGDPDPDGSSPEMGCEYYPHSRYVPEEYPTITDALADNYNNAEVVVTHSSGTYEEYAVIDDGDVLYYDPAHNFGIRGVGDWSFKPDASYSCIFNIDDSDTPILLKDLKFVSNTAVPNARAIYGYLGANEGCELTLQDCVFDNFGALGSIENGGAVYLVSEDRTGSLEILGQSDFTGNEADYGGAIHCNGFSVNINEQASYSRVVFDSNTATEQAGAVYAVHMPNTDVAIYHTDFLNNVCNTADENAAEALRLTLHEYGNATCDIENTVFEYNDNPAFFNYYFTTVNITACVFHSEANPQPFSIKCWSSGTQLYLTSSILPYRPTGFGVYNIDYSNIVYGTNPDPNGDGNIQENPLFVDPANDNYHLRWDSECLDTGDPNEPEDYDHTRCDMGFHPVYEVVLLSGSADLVLDRGWYHVTGNASDDCIQVAAGSVIHFDDGKALTVTGNSSQADAFYIGEPDNERTTITGHVLDGLNPDYLGAITITGNNSGSSQDDELEVHHLRYQNGEGTLNFSKLELDVDDLNFVDCTNMLMLGNDCSGLVAHSSFSGTEEGTSANQVVMLYNSVSLLNCELESYNQNGILLSGCTHPSSQPFEWLSLDGTQDGGNSQNGTYAINSSIRYENSYINNHNKAGILLSCGLADLGKDAEGGAYNNLDENNVGEGDALIYMTGKPVKLNLNGGYNSFYRGSGLEYQNEMYVKDLSGITHTSTKVEYNYWANGGNDPSLYLPSNWGTIDYSPYLSSWIPPINPYSSAEGGGPVNDKGSNTDDDFTTPEELAFQEAIAAEDSGDFATAIEMYFEIIEDYSSSTVALASVYRLKYIGHNIADYTTEVLLGIESRVNSIDNTDLVAAMIAAYWWLYGVHQDVLPAISALENLVDAPEQADYRFLFQETLLYLQIFQDAGGTLGAPQGQSGDLLVQQQTEYLQQLGQLLDIDIQSEQGVVPTSIQLYQNYPNPFNPTTTLSFSLSTDMDVELTVYNITGQQVAQLVSGWKSAGEHQLQFDGRDLSSGLYFYRLAAAGQTEIRKMMLIK